MIVTVKKLTGWSIDVFELMGNDLEPLSGLLDTYWLTRKDIDLIKKLGYVIEIVTEKVEI